MKTTKEQFKAMAKKKKEKNLIERQTNITYMVEFLPSIVKAKDMFEAMKIVREDIRGGGRLAIKKIYPYFKKDRKEK